MLFASSVFPSSPGSRALCRTRSLLLTYFVSPSICSRASCLFST